LNPVFFPLNPQKSQPKWKITIFHGKIHYKWPFSIANITPQLAPPSLSSELNCQGAETCSDQRDLSRCGFGESIPKRRKIGVAKDGPDWWIFELW